MIHPTRPITDPKMVAEIAHEIEFGTPDTPQRIATIRRADELYALYARTVLRPQFRTKVLDWIASCPHRAVEAAWNDMLHEFHLYGNWEVGKMHMGHLLHFIESLAERTL